MAPADAIYVLMVITLEDLTDGPLEVDVVETDAAAEDHPGARSLPPDRQAHFPDRDFHRVHNNHKYELPQNCLFCA